MDRKVVSVWHDAEGDYLEVLFEQAEGYFRESDDQRVMEKVNPEGDLLGFSIIGVSSLKDAPLEVVLE